MPGLIALVAFTPIVLSAAVILWLRRSAAIGALSGTAIALAWIPLFDAFGLDVERVRVALISATILTLSAVLVIVPGLYLNAILRGQGVVDGLAAWIQSLRLDAERKALVLLLGPLPAVESLTGFGVSLFLAVPIFFRLFPAERAYRMSLLGMNIMPWGTLALATVIAASLSGLPVAQLGAATALTSALVFPAIGLIALCVLGGPSLLRKHALLATLLGLALAALLFAFSRFGFTEIAGILAGTVVGVLGFAGLRQASQSAEQALESGRFAAAPVDTQSLPIWRLLQPYALVLGLILLSRIPALHALLSDAVVLSSGRVRFSLLTSPGWALAIVALLLLAIRSVPIDHKVVWSRAKTASIGILCFVVLAQLMLESGMINAIAAPLEQQGAQHKSLLYLLSPLLGAVSGFTTGSNVGGNALLTVMQHRLGAATGEALLFTAAQNSAAGHAVFASLPIIILVATIARDTAHQTPMAEHELLRFTLKALCLVVMALVLSCALIGSMGLLVTSDEWLIPR